MNRLQSRLQSERAACQAEKNKLMQVGTHRPIPEPCTQGCQIQLFDMMAYSDNQGTIVS